MPTLWTSPSRPPARLQGLDALRGLAMLWMTAFHFSFDLNYFGYIQQDFYLDPVWTWQRSAIVSLFLLAAGCGQAAAVVRGQGWPRFWWRWAQVAGCAALVTAASWIMFPRSFIYFGVLHGLAAMLIATRWLLVRGTPQAALLAGGAMLIALYWIAPAALNAWAGTEAAGLFNSRALNWLGLITRKPITEDYVPLVPWLGVMLWGAAAGRWLLARRPHWLALGATNRAAGALLAALGRWSLSYYMLHQPVLIGALIAIGWLTGRA
ncbi:MAG: DUF1624 domain-containing protein [Burkholderiaceae bacterium]|nr:DUF1624 domain-containing protein [Burkholderiaceae bacterium]